MVTDQAPMATLFNPKHVDFVSKRVGNFTFSKQFYWLVSQSWVRRDVRGAGRAAVPLGPLPVSDALAGQRPRGRLRLRSPGPAPGARPPTAAAEPDRDGDARSSWS